jgi:hypothetical protein
MGSLMDATAPGLPALDATFMAMFRAEWQAQRGDAPLRTVLVVDDAPLRHSTWRPEFALARQLFESHGLVAAVADARTLQWRDGQLWHPACARREPGGGHGLQPPDGL